MTNVLGWREKTAAKNKINRWATVGKGLTTRLLALFLLPKDRVKEVVLI
jgi:hypothetical protein